jgi:DNA primase
MDQFAEVILKIKESVDLVDLVQEYIPLTRRGRTAVALCPFHAEKTPSFTVYPDRQFYKCYGCGKGGDLFDFLLEKEGWSFREAAEILAEKLGISMQGVFSRGRDPNAKRLDVHGTLGKVRDWFAQVLASPAGAEVRDYLESRNLLVMAEQFGLGAHPSQQGALRKFAAKYDLSLEVLAQAGLLSRGGAREPFAGRAMFPIIDERGRVVGFGGRVLPSTKSKAEQGPKYLNSPESPFFNKRRLLFGLRQAKEAGARKIIVVEGYTDVIACHRVGMRGVVASLGTALTAEHARMLERYATEGVVLLFDGDQAGRRAADKAFCELVHTTLPVKLALLPEGSDPADLVADAANADAGEESSTNRLAVLVDQAEDAIRMWFKLLGQRYDLNLDVDIQRAAAECGSILAQVESLARREALQRAMARYLGVSEEALSGSIPRRRKPTPRQEAVSSQPEKPAAKMAPMPEAECYLLASLLADVGLMARCLQEPRGDGDFRRILDMISEAGAEHLSSSSAVTNYLFARLGANTEARRFLAESLDRAHRITDAESIFHMAQRDRRAYFAKEKAGQLFKEVQKAMAAGDQELTDELTRQYMNELRQTQG